MKWVKHRKAWTVITVIVLALVACIGIQLLIIKYNGSSVPPPKNIPRSQTFGSGPTVTYTVFGDSTAVAQGGAYDQGIAVQSAQFIASKNHTVHLHNYGVSGARTHDVLAKQLPSMAETPDVVLLSVSANDITHGTRVGTVKRDMESIVATLRQKNPDVKIIITGTPAMGSIPRFPQPTRWLASERTKQMNHMFAQLSSEQTITNVEIAKKLGPMFAKNPDLFAEDKFHPNTAGYDEWSRAITDTLDSTLTLP
jgi:lysophospholipase L1-like esterase